MEMVVRGEWQTDWGNISESTVAHVIASTTKKVEMRGATDDMLILQS
jgi:hypothetical protein